VSFEDDISALIDRPCRRNGCARTLPESCPSDDFCSEDCETTWRAENNGLTTVDCGEFGIDMIVPDGHPAAPSYRSPQEDAFDSEPPRSFREYVWRRLSQMFDRAALDDVEQFQENAAGILSAIRPDELPQRRHSVGLMQILPSSWRRDPPVSPSDGLARFLDQYGVTPRAWSQPGTFQTPAVPPTEVEVHRMREQVARIFEVPLSMIDPPPPPRPREIPGEFQVLNELGAPPVNFTASPTPGLAFDPATPDMRLLFYTVETRYDHQRDRVVADLVLRVPRPGWANVAFDGIGYVQSVRDRAEAFQQLTHGEWTEPTEDARRHRLEGAGLEQLAGLDAEEIVARARELGFVGVDPEPEIPPYRDQSET
jgi:hypothetical protein